MSWYFMTVSDELCNYLEVVKSPKCFDRYRQHSNKKLYNLFCHTVAIKTVINLHHYF